LSTIEQYPQFPPNEPFPRRIQIPDPAAGAEINYACPHGHRFKILGLQFLLTADANVANRNVDLFIAQGLFLAFAHDYNFPHMANQPYTYHILPGQIRAQFFVGFNVWPPTGWPLYFFYGQSLFTTTDNIQVGDQFSNIYLYGFSWPDFVNNPPA